MKSHRTLWIALLMLSAIAAPVSAAQPDPRGSARAALAIGIRPLCNRIYPGFEENTRESYERLREQYPEVAQQIEALPPDPPPEEDALPGLRYGCAAELDYVLNLGRPPNPRLETPEKTWNLFLEALRAGDKKTLAESFSPGWRDGYMATLESWDAAALAKLAASFNSFSLKKSYFPGAQEAYVTTSEGGGGHVSFQKDERGWRIVGLPAAANVERRP